MSNVIYPPSILAPLGADENHVSAPTGVVSLPRLLAGYRSVLCAIEPDPVGRRIVARVADVMGRHGRFGIVSAAHFDLPVDASACLFPTPLDRRARLIVERQQALDALVTELRLSEAEVFATAGNPGVEVNGVAALWQADVVLFARSAKIGLRTQRGGARRRFDTVALDDEGLIAGVTWLEKLFGA